MASLQHGRFRDELAKVLASHPDESEQYLIRSALMWLSVAQRPLQAHELWIAFQVEESMDIEHIERLLTVPEYVNEAKATASLQNLLGGLITIRSDGSGQSAVSLSDPELRTYLTHLDGAGDASTFGFTTHQAHVVVASVCMVICSVSTLHLAHVHDETTASSLVLYSWSSWSSHLALSGFLLSNENAANLFNTMVFRVCTDVLVFLLALNDFVTGPITLPATEDHLKCQAIVQKAQQTLEAPISLLSALLRQPEYARVLQSAQQTVEAARDPAVKSSLAASLRGKTAPTADEATAVLQESLRTVKYGAGSRSKTDVLRIDRAWLESAAVLGEPEKRLIQAFAETSRGLRAVCIALSEPLLYDELLKQFDGSWSPTDVLVNTANWMEAVAGYPYWQELPPSSISEAFNIFDTDDENFEVAILINSRVRAIDSGKGARETYRGPSSRPATATTQKKLPGGISARRWQVATVVDKLKALRRSSATGSTFTINDLRLLSQRTSSFSRVPSQIHGGEPLDQVSSFMPKALRLFYRRRAGPLFERAANSAFLKPLDGFARGAFAGAAGESAWISAKAAILDNGYGTAMTYFVIAILVHHVRRILVPWLGTHVYYTPVEDLRLALTRPDVFLEEALSLSWVWIVFAICQKTVWDALGIMALNLLSVDNGRLPPDTRQVLQPNPWLIPWFERFMDLCKLSYLVWAFSIIEYIFDRVGNTVAFYIAYGRLLFGGDPEHIALGRILKTHWLHAAWSAYLIYTYTRTGIWSMVWGSVVSAAVGQPALLVLLLVSCGAVAGLIRYRSRLYVAIEVAGLFVVLGFAVVVAVLLAVEFVSDPLGFETSTAHARKAAARARTALPRGSATRTQILRRQAAVPVSIPAEVVTGGGVTEVEESSPSQPAETYVEDVSHQKAE